MKNLFLTVGWVMCVCLCVSGQTSRRDTRVFQVSLTPAIGTNGLHPGGYSNYFSLNFTSGYSRANYLLEIGILSNLNVEETRGLQVAGLVNVTGGNAFAGMQKKERDQKVKSGFEANLSGIQLAGITNVVLNNVFGSQTSGLANVAKGALQGVQISGGANVVYKYTFGVQLAGLFNISQQSMDGVQVSGLWNYTSGGLYGIQIGAFNKCGFIEGRNTYENQNTTGLQLGLINSSNKMNGFQVGLINFSKRSQGTMIGLINIFRNGTTAQTRDGTSIGLVNIGTDGYASAYISEWFLMNFEIATGNSKNMRISTDSQNKYVQNALIFSNHAHQNEEGKDPWAFGYGFRKYYFNRSSLPGRMNYRFLSVGLDVMHVNEEKKKVTDHLSLMARPKIKAGTRLHPKLFSVYVFGALSWQVYASSGDTDIVPDLLTSTFNWGDTSLAMWPGFSAGIHIQ